MGNYVSCTLSPPGGVLGQPCRAAKVVMPGGEVRRVEGPAKAAEIMLETPSCFLVDARALRMGRRLSPLGADDDLEMATVYVTFPMKRLNSLVTAADMAAVFLAAEAAKKKRRNKANSKNNNNNNNNNDDNNNLGGGRKMKRILPAEEVAEEKWQEDDVAAVPKLNLDDIEEFSAPEFMHRLSMSRSKKPLLETIVEDQPVCLR